METTTFTFSKTVKLEDYSKLDANELEKSIYFQTSFYLYIDYPLTYPHIRVVRTSAPIQVSVKELLDFIYLQYTQIYDREEKTITDSGLEIRCPNCFNINLSFYDATFKHIPFDTETCSICLSARKSSKIVLSCNHKYHYNCVKKWFAMKNDCPLCKEPIVRCETCNSSRYTTFWNIFLSGREPTNGIYGIGSVYLKDIKIKGIVYDPEKHLLMPIVEQENIFFN